eukprot:UN03467
MNFDINFDSWKIVLIAGGLQLPICMLRDMSSLQWSSTFGFMCCTYLCVALGIEYFLLCGPCFWEKHYGRQTIFGLVIT